MEFKATENIEALRHTMVALNGLKFIRSDQAKGVYSAMKEDDFRFDYENISSEAAKSLVDLLNLAVMTFDMLSIAPDIVQIVPSDVIAGMANIKKQLLPWERFLNKAAKGDDFDREKEMMKVVSSHLNQKFLGDKLG